MNYEELSRKLEEASLSGNLQSEAERLKAQGADSRQLDALLHPEDQPPVIRLSECICSNKDKAACEINCLFEAIKRDENGTIVIANDCTGCGECVKSCENHNLVERKDVIPLLELLKSKEYPVYAMIAPAFSGQFSEEVTSGKLRSAFKILGFYGMLEVALFADILTLKEALEFDRSINNDEDFLLTSCCCPIWVALIRKKYSDMIPHVPPSVSPMVACGRVIKKIHPEAKTVFIGPCIAKKAEAREADIADAVDYVLTFEEIAEIFKFKSIDPAELPEDSSDHSSSGGRIYARTSGVSEAVQKTLERLRPDRKIKLQARQGDGVVACKEMLKDIAAGNINANFIEGMGCKGGCVGGPKSLLSVEEATKHVEAYAAAATSKTPANNQHVLDILHRLGFDTIDSLLERDNTFIRNFSKL